MEFRVRHDHIIHSPGEPCEGWTLEHVVKLLMESKQRGILMAGELADLAAQVAQNKSLLGSAIQTMQGLSAKLSTALDALRSEERRVGKEC